MALRDTFKMFDAHGLNGVVSRPMVDLYIFSLLGLRGHPTSDGTFPSWV